MANHAFYDVPIRRLPVFSATYTPDGKIRSMQFLSNDLADNVLGFIGQALVNVPIKLKPRVLLEKLKREREVMVWWLWYNVGHSEHKRKLSFGEISSIAVRPRSSVQSVVERFNRKLTKEINARLLGDLLRVAGSLGLEYNLVYNILAQQGLVPARKRGIDSFDDLDTLI